MFEFGGRGAVGVEGVWNGLEHLFEDGVGAVAREGREGVVRMDGEEGGRWMYAYDLVVILSKTSIVDRTAKQTWMNVLVPNINSMYARGKSSHEV